MLESLTERFAHLNPSVSYVKGETRLLLGYLLLRTPRHVLLRERDRFMRHELRNFKQTMVPHNILATFPFSSRQCVTQSKRMLAIRSMELGRIGWHAPESIKFSFCLRAVVAWCQETQRTLLWVMSEGERETRGREPVTMTENWGQLGQHMGWLSYLL